MNSNIMAYILIYLKFVGVFAIACVIGVSILIGISMIIRWRRRRLVDRRIVEQSKALGVWDKNPIVLGGRALEIKAWERFKIKRKPGETDKDLRRRCMNAADNEYAVGKITVCKSKTRKRRDRQ